MRHCDEYIDDASQPECLRAFLAYARKPAHGMLSTEPPPKLFANLKDKRVRVTMASRFGDVGITTNFRAPSGYEARVYIEQLADFSAEP